MNATTPELLECGHAESPHSSFTRGYGTDDQGNRHCYDCCARRDREAMLATGRIVLYIDSKGENVTNWPGSLSFEVGTIRASRIGFCRDGRLAYFRGLGMYARCRRLKD